MPLSKLRHRIEGISINKTKGISLVELLIAVLIVSLGLLGTSELMTKTLQFNQGAAARTQATILAEDLVEIYRANGINASGDFFDAEIDEWNQRVSSDLPGGTSVRETDLATNSLSITLTWLRKGGEDPQSTITFQTRASI